VIQEVGLAAKQMLGRTPGNITAIRPMKDGVIADFTVTEQMLKQFIKKVLDSRSSRRRRASSSACPAVPRRSSGARSASRRWARALQGLSDRGADGRGDRRRPADLRRHGLDGGRHRRRHHRGRRDLAGRHGVRGSVRVGGDKFDEAIVNYIRRNYGMLIGETTAETIKKTIGSHSRIRSQGNGSEGPQPCRRHSAQLHVSSNEILEALTDPLNSIVSAVKSALERTPPELGADIAERGMVLTGGGALLRDVDRLLMEETGLPVIVADDPLTCVVRGCGKALEKHGKAADDLHVGLAGVTWRQTRISLAGPGRIRLPRPRKSSLTLGTRPRKSTLTLG
jgi:rod shape-determining protein MreB